MKQFTPFLWMLSLAFLFAFTGCQSGTPNESEPEKIVEMPISTQSKEAKAAVLSGLSIWDLGNSQDAHAEFTKALEHDPKLALAHVLAGATGGSAQAFGDGLANAKANLEGASDFEKKMIEYVETYAKNDSESRLLIAQKMANDYPHLARCQTYLGNNYWERNEIANSREAYQKAIEIDPNWTSGYNSLARSYLFAEPKDLAKAEMNTSKVVELAADNPHAHILLGDCYRGQNKLEQASNAYAKAIQLDPEDYETYYKKGHADTFLGKLKEARGDYQKGRQYDDDKFVGFEAYTYLYAGEPETALKWLEGKVNDIASLGISPDRMGGAKLDMLDDCAWMAFHMGNAAQLKDLKTQMVPLSEQQAKGVGSTEAVLEHNAGMLFWDALIAATEGKAKEADAKLAQAETTLEPINNPRKLEGLHFAHGFVNMQKKDYAAAVAEFEKGNQDWVYNQYWLAKANEMAGNQEKAAELYGKVASNNFNSVFNGLVRKEVMAKTESI